MSLTSSENESEVRTAKRGKRRAVWQTQEIKVKVFFSLFKWEPIVLAPQAKTSKVQNISKNSNGMLGKKNWS